RDRTSIKAANFERGHGQRPSEPRLLSSMTARTTLGDGAIFPRVRKRRSSQLSSIVSKTGVCATNSATTIRIVPAVSVAGMRAFGEERLKRKRLNSDFMGDPNRLP